jgi:hypothetical protein
MPFCSKPLGAALSIAAIATAAMASPGRAQQDLPAAGQETPAQMAPDAKLPDAKPPQDPAPDVQAPLGSAPASQAPSARAAAPPPKRAQQLAPARPGIGKSAVVTASVNLRSGPGTDSDVIATIPAGSTVRVADCSEWCAVTWNGHGGYAIARNLGPAALRQARPYPVQPGYDGDYELEPPVIYGAPGYYAPPAVVYGPAYYGPRVYYGPGLGGRRHWW